MPPAYFVMNHPRRPNVPSTHLQGVQTSLHPTASQLDPSGPALPLVVEFFPGDVTDLFPILNIIESMDCADIAEDGQDLFIRDIVSEIAIRQIAVFPHVNKFYGIIKSSKANKFVAMDFSTEDAGPSYEGHVFPTFVKAFVYVLAGGNENLRKWGLDEWMGVLRLPFLPVSMPLSPRVPASRWLKDGRAQFHGSPIPDPFDMIMAEDGVSVGVPLETYGKSNKGKGKERRVETPEPEIKVEDESEMDYVQGPSGAEYDAHHISAGGQNASGTPIKTPIMEADDDTPNTPESQHGSYSHNSSGAPANDTQNASTSQVNDPFEYVVPQAYLRELRDTPFMRVSPPSAGSRGLTFSHEGVASTRNGPLDSEVEFPHLPPLVVLYLRAHGWDRRVINVVAIAYTCEATHVGFLNTMTLQGMPLSEASFLWHAMRAIRDLN